MTTASPTEQQRVAVIGASQNRKKFGNKCVRAYLQAGWEVYPVNPHTERIEGLRAVPVFAAVPETVDRICLYLPPERTRRLLPQLPRHVEVFFNPGSADAAVLAEARSLGLEVRDACAIVAIGLSPSQFGT